MATLEHVENETVNDDDYNLPLIRDIGRLPDSEAPVGPNNPPWSALTATGTWIFSVLAIMILPAIIVLPYFIANRENLPTDLLSDPTAVVLNLLALIPAHLLTLAVAWLVATKNRQFSLDQTLGFRSGGVKWWHYPLFLVGFVTLGAAVGYFFPDGDNDMLRMLRTTRVAVYIVAALATITAPIVEEVVYRGLLYSAFQRKFGVPAAVGIVTLLFALVHVPQYLGSPGTIVLVCLLSLMLTLIRVKSENLLPCIVMHAIFNGLQSIALLAGWTDLK